MSQAISKTVRIFSKLGLVLLFLFPTAFVQADELVESFIAVYEIQPDGSVRVIEQIQYDFDDNERRGIFRDLLTTHRQDATVWYKNRELLYSNFSVTRNGQSEPFIIESIYQGIRVRIGDPDITHTGSHEYEITYVVDGALSYYDDGTAEFYWNVTGDGWVVPIEMVRAAVLGEESVRILEDERDCYVGRSGDTDRCESALVEGLGLGFGAGSLRPRQQLTIAVAVDAETVEKNIVEHFIFHPIALLYVIFVIGFIVYIAVRIRRWRNQGKGNQPVIVQYGSYPDFDPLYTQAFYFGYLQHPGLIAGLITLAQQGVIHLQRIETQQSKTILGRTASRPQVDYEITLKTNTDSVQDPYLKRVIRVFFADTINAPHKVRMSEVVKDRSRTLREFNQLKTAISNSIFNQDNGYYVQDFPKKEYKFYVISLVILGILSIVGIYWLMFFSMILLFMIFALGMYLGLSVKNGHRMTAQGHEIYRHIEGFKKFLCLTERDRLQFHNAPTRSPETYMQYLPYAIALGVEKEWAAAFADVTIPEQDWYSDTSANATFSGLLLSRELGSFTRTAATSPQSSSSSSGSSGRGSAGGGSGGGGGGSW